MKHIIIEGLDRCGKSSLIAGLCKHYEFDNVTVRHMSKPPKGEIIDWTVLNWQLIAFVEETLLLDRIRANEKKGYCYYENKVIWNRSHIGEIVWGPLYRKSNKELIKEKLRSLEQDFLKNEEYAKNTFLIYLYADAEFLNEREDGNSFSNTIEQKQRELDLFEEAIDFSIIRNKLKLKVCDENKQFYSKDYVLSQIINFLQ